MAFLSRLPREHLETEIKAIEGALKAHKEGILVNQIVLEAFEKELKKYPKPKEKPKP